MSFVSSKGNILCRLINIELYKIFAIINRAIKGLYCTLIFFSDPLKIMFLAAANVHTWLSWASIFLNCVKPSKFHTYQTNTMDMVHVQAWAKMGKMLQTTFGNTFSWMKTFPSQMPLSKLKLNYNQQGAVPFTWGQSNRKCSIHDSLKCTWKLFKFEIRTTSHMDQWADSLWPSDAIWWHRSGSTLAQVIAWRHQAITWTNVDLSSVRYSGILLE